MKKRFPNRKYESLELTEEERTGDKISAAALNDEKMTEAERLARDILAPLAVAELMRQEGNRIQKSTARRLGETFADCGAVCGESLWFCGCDDERALLTLAGDFYPYAFGRTCPGGCFILITRNNKEEERAYLVRPVW